MIVSCIVLGLASRSRAAKGSAGTNMCIAKVPLKVISTSSHSGGAACPLGLLGWDKAMPVRILRQVRQHVAQRRRRGRATADHQPG